jgi:hypothetical protein
MGSSGAEFAPLLRLEAAACIPWAAEQLQGLRRVASLLAPPQDDEATGEVGQASGKIGNLNVAL